ncbi:MAG: ubiquitin-like small modifier protein 1 [Solirubrobacteraceae bacterium]
MATIKVKIPTQLRDATGGEGNLTVEGDTVGAALEALFTAHPELRGRIADDEGNLRRFVNVYLDGEDIRFGEGPATTLSDRQELQILPAVAGGR